jgi:hypothetical protein
VDLVLVRSFRAPDLAERAIKDLARSRLDTGREVVFQPLGGRFLEAREDAGRIVALLREDAFHAENGHFTRMTLRVDSQLAARLAGLEPRAVERRLEDATRDAILRERPRAQGIYLVRFEPSARGGLEPVAHVHLSCRTADGGPAPALTREDARRFETAWSRDVETAFCMARDLGREHDRASALAPEAERLRQEWARASARLFTAYTERLHGKATHKELADALASARSARAAWNRVAGPPVDLRDVEERRIFDVVRLRIEGGARYFRGQFEGHQRALLETAATSAAGLLDERDRRLAVVAWPTGPDLQGVVYFNQRARPEPAEGSLDPERLRASLEARLAHEVRCVAPTLDPTAEARARDLGRVEARLPERGPAREGVATAREREREPVPEQAAPALVVRLERQHLREAETAAVSARNDEEQTLARLRPPERDWSEERVFAIRLRIPTGAEQLEALGLNAEETSRVVQRAVDRAYPFLEREGVRDSFLHSAHGRALDIQVIVPEKLGWTPQQLRSPQFQQRFMTGFHQALSQVAPTRIGPEPQPMLPGFERGVAAIHQAPQMLRRAEQDPERAAKDLARAVFSKLSEALPKPFRLMRDLGRTVSRFVPRGE